MKLILCKKCHDVYKLTTKGERTCDCGLTWGRYLSDGLKAEVSDNEYTQVLGFHNGTLLEAIAKQNREGDREDGFGHQFIAFLMPDVAPNVRKVRLDMAAICTLGMGCEEAGMCYASAHNAPEQCGKL